MVTNAAFSQAADCNISSKKWRCKAGLKIVFAFKCRDADQAACIMALKLSLLINIRPPLAITGTLLLAT